MVTSVLAAEGARTKRLSGGVEYEVFSTCWPEDVLKAKGLVSEVRRVVEVKDSFTRIRQEKEAEANARRSAADQKATVLEERRQTIESV